MDLLNSIHKINVTRLDFNILNVIDDDAVIDFINDKKNLETVNVCVLLIFKGDIWFAVRKKNKETISYGVYQLNKKDYIIVKLKMYYEFRQRLEKPKPCRLILRLPHHLVEYIDSFFIVV